MKKSVLLVIVLFSVFNESYAQDCNMNEIAKKHFYRADAIFTETATENDLKFVVNEYNNALKYAPNCPTIYFNLGLINEKLGKNKPYLYNIAIQNFSKYLLLVPNTPDKEAVQNKIYEIRGKIADLINTAMSEEQMYDLVRNYYNKVLENEPNRSDIYFNLALIYENLSKKNILFYNYASDCYEKYLELEPNAPNQEQIKNKLYEIDGKRDFASINRNEYYDQFDLPHYQVGAKYETGMIYQGGIIFYVDKSGKHGLIAATDIEGYNIVWSKEDIKIGGTTEKVGSGRNNTERIVKKLGDGVYAAKLCDDLVLNDYDDWFLPSRDELCLLYKNYLHEKCWRWDKRSIPYNECSDCKDDYVYQLYDISSEYLYWSSSEDNNTYVIWNGQLGEGSSVYYSHTPTKVLPVRAF